MKQKQRNTLPFLDIMLNHMNNDIKGFISLLVLDYEFVFYLIYLDF